MNSIGKLLVLCCIALGVNGEKQFRLAARAEQARLGEFPHQVSIRKNGRHHCGGSLISRIHVLTAAHCVYDLMAERSTMAQKVNRLVVEVGSVRLGSGKTHAVKRIAYKQDYEGSATSRRFLPNDVSLITLKTPVTLSANVKIINLPPPYSTVPLGSKVVVSGYGSAKINGPISYVLQKSELYIVSNKECNEYYTNRFRKMIIASHICAKRGQGYGTCKGDSGGPMVYNNQIVGLVSGGDGFCGAGNPDVYTRVSHFVHYIRSEMNHREQRSDDFDDLSRAVDFDES